MAWLSKMYNTIIAATGLTNRGAFRVSNFYLNMK